MSDPIVKQVQSQYAAVAVSGLSTNHAGVKAVAEAFGYTAEELASTPAEANMGLSCGNPTAFAHRRPGATVVDLGCGSGLGVLLAAKKPLPDEVRSSVMAYVGCIAGAILIEEYEHGLREAGFAAVQIMDTHKDLRAYAKMENQHCYSYSPPAHPRCRVETWRRWRAFTIKSPRIQGWRGRFGWGRSRLLRMPSAPVLGFNPRPTGRPSRSPC